MSRLAAGGECFGQSRLRLGYTEGAEKAFFRLGQGLVSESHHYREIRPGEFKRDLWTRGEL